MEQGPLPLVSLVTSARPLSDLVAEVGKACGVAVVVPETVRKSDVPADFDRVEGMVALRTLAGAVGLGATRLGDVVVFEPPGKAVDGVEVIPVGGQQAEQLSTLLRGIAGEHATVTVVEDRVYVVGSNVALRRVAAARDALRSSSDGWLVEVQLVRVSSKFLRDLGVETKFSAQARIGGSVGSLQVVGAGASALVEAVAHASEDQSDADVMYRSPLFVVEGRSAKFSSGERVPIPKRTVSDQGTVTISGYDFIDSGFTVTAEARRVGERSMFQLNPSLSSISGYVGEVPILSKVESSAFVTLASGESVVLAGLDSRESVQKTSGLPGFRPWVNDTRSDSVVLFTARATRVSRAIEQ